MPDQPGDSEWRPTFLASGLRVPLAPPQQYWTEFLSSQGIVPPVLLVLRGGRIVATFSADARGVAPALASLFAGP